MHFHERAFGSLARRRGRFDNFFSTEREFARAWNQKFIFRRIPHYLRRIQQPPTHALTPERRS
jgi:hypothetical protein